ncbi:hypothetical protein PY365_03830 [Roseiarcaceae bacterium H3SJ34-1]|uniref:hypothetical protein n=1 Tax=Terripilifer ovatus TaxID=3032367 RepID=UPI003AB966CC|nr:hypothetical protein [Roseiarcaceae bacterium H3SJ34-1]
MPIEAFEDRILNDLLPAFCNDPARRYDIAGFRQDFSKVHEKDAKNFLRALDAGLVKLEGRLYRAPLSRAGEQFFWDGKRAAKPRLITLWLEPIITVAALCKLHFDFQWPKQLLGTQSVDWAFDVTAYLEADLLNERIACEVKKTADELIQLVELMHHFRRSTTECPKAGKPRNAYKKVQGLRARRAPIFWALGPGGQSLVFNVSYDEDGTLSFDEASSAALAYPGSVSQQSKSGLHCAIDGKMPSSV